MAIFQAYLATNMLSPPSWVGLQNISTPWQIGIMDRAGRDAVDRYGATYNGTFKTDFDTGALLGGTVTNYVGLKNGASQFIITDITAPILDIYRKGPIIDHYPAVFAGRDAINGSAGNDMLGGFAGADTINGGAGNDIAYGGLGDDVVIYSAGNDQVYGE